MKTYTFDDIRKEGLLIYEYIRGSHAYGLQKPDGTSDIDTAGVYIEPVDQLLGLVMPFNLKPYTET
ncbi:MAG: nucleotidyltransferase domain-containing protein [Bacteroidales bacterium]|nr:nucleotidyltransferase domain-containing protein [Bacteroidales bacterium]